MSKTLLLLAAFTVAVIGAAYGLKMAGLEFLAVVSGVVFLFKCSHTINAEQDARQPQQPPASTDD